MLNRRRFILGAPLDVIFIVVILYYTAGCARCKGERGENARNMSESADEEGHIAQKQMEIIGFLTKDAAIIVFKNINGDRNKNICHGLFSFIAARCFYGCRSPRK